MRSASSIVHAVADALAIGDFYEFDPGTSAYITIAGAGQLISNLAARTVGPPGMPPVSITGTPRQYVSGTRATSNPDTGNTYSVTYDQFVGFNDQPVNPPHVYHIVLTWAQATLTPSSTPTTTPTSSPRSTPTGTPTPHFR